MAKSICLTQGLSTIVDDDVFELLDRFNWHNSKGYASRWIPAPNGRTRVFMQNVILNVDRGVDHIDRNPLNNQRHNLRLVSWSLQSSNRLMPKRDLPRGVTINHGKFAARISIDNQDYRLGMYDTVKEAHDAYLAKCFEIRGEYPPQ